MKEERVGNAIRLACKGDCEINNADELDVLPEMGATLPCATLATSAKLREQNVKVREKRATREMRERDVYDVCFVFPQPIESFFWIQDRVIASFLHDNVVETFRSTVETGIKFYRDSCYVLVISISKTIGDLIAQST